MSEPRARAGSPSAAPESSLPDAAPSEPSESRDARRSAVPPADQAGWGPPSWRDRLLSAGLWGIGAGWLTAGMGTMMAAQRVLPPDRIEWLSRLYCRGQVLLTGSRWRAVVHPAVDPETVYMFAQNHTNHFDHVVLYPATPHFKQGMELERHFRYPVYGWFMKQRGTIAVPDRREGRLELLHERCRAEVQRGHSLLVFPEGTRTLDGHVGPFRLGVFEIARRLGIPIVPVAVTGSYEMMRKGSWIIRPGHTITVYVEEPIPTRGLQRKDVPELARRVRAVIAARIDAYWERRQSEQTAGT